MSRTILVTGASNGIGYQTALQLAVENNIVIALARNKNKLEALCNEALEQNGAAKIYPLPFDLSSQDYKSLSNELHQLNITKIDCLINNAGLLINKPFEQLQLEDFKQVYQVNVFAPAMLIQTLLPLLKQSNDAHIINISSMGGVGGTSKFAGLSAYSSSKGALLTLSECLATEFAPLNIKVNCLALGGVNTEMLAGAFPGYEAPLSATKMAEWISWFALNGQQFFNGKVIPVAVSNP